MKKISVLLIVLAFSSLAFAQDSSVYLKKGVPEYNYKTFYFEGWDLFRYHKQGDDDWMYINLTEKLDIYLQTADMDIKYGEVSDFHYSKVGDADATAVFDLDIYGGVTKYFGLPQVFGDFNLNYINDSDKDDPGRVLELNIGGGVGRVYNATTVAQAIVIGKELGVEMSNEKVIEVSYIIEREAYYRAKYKDNFGGKYYGDIAATLGKPEKVMKVRQILVSSVYVISTRQIGWQARVGYHKWFLASEDDPYYNQYYESKGDIWVRGDFAKPLDLDKQFTAFLQYNKSLEEEPNNSANLEIGADISINHLFTWRSYAGLGLDMDMTPDNDSDMDYEFFVGTEKNILSKLLGGARFSFEQTGYSSDNDAAMGFNIYFKYFPFPF